MKTTRTPEKARKPPLRGQASARRHLHLWLLGVALLSVVVYLNTFGNAFVFDDLDIIRDNVRIRSLSNIPELFSTNYWGDRANQGLYRPLVLTTYALNYSFGQLNTTGYTILNLALHAGVTMLLVLLIRNLGGTVLLAGVTGLFFAVHPVHTEAVTGFVGRAETLTAFLVLLALLLHRRIPIVTHRRALTRAAAVLAFLLAMFTKENAITFIGVVAVMDWLLPTERRDSHAGGFRARLRTDYVLYVAAIALYLTIRIAVLGSIAGGVETTTPQDNPLVPTTSPTVMGNIYGTDFVDSKLTAIAVLPEYTRLLLWPARLSCDYSIDQIPVVTSPVDPRFLAGLAILIAVSAGFVWLLRNQRLAAFGVAVMALTFVLSSNLVFAIGTICGERLIYLPSAGLALIAACTWERLARSRGGRYRTVAIGVLVVVTALAGGRTWARNVDWRGSRTLWESTVRAAPKSAKAHSNLGHALLADSKALAAAGDDATARSLLDTAGDHLEHALRIYPESWRTVNTLTNVELQRDNLEHALELCAVGVQLEPTDHMAYSNWAIALMRDGDRLVSRAETAATQGHEQEAEQLRTRSRAVYEDAVVKATEAINLAPGFANNYFNRAMLYLYRIEQPDQAMADFRRVLELAPNHPAAAAIRQELARH